MLLGFLLVHEAADVSAPVGSVYYSHAGSEANAEMSCEAAERARPRSRYLIYLFIRRSAAPRLNVRPSIPLFPSAVTSLRGNFYTFDTK